MSLVWDATRTFCHGATSRKGPGQRPEDYLPLLEEREKEREHLQHPKLVKNGQRKNGGNSRFFTAGATLGFFPSGPPKSQPREKNLNARHSSSGGILHTHPQKEGIVLFMVCRQHRHDQSHFRHQKDDCEEKGHRQTARRALLGTQSQLRKDATSLFSASERRSLRRGGKSPVYRCSSKWFFCTCYLRASLSPQVVRQDALSGRRRGGGGSRPVAEGPGRPPSKGQDAAFSSKKSDKAPPLPACLFISASRASS